MDGQGYKPEEPWWIGSPQRACSISAFFEPPRCGFDFFGGPADRHGRSNHRREGRRPATSLRSPPLTPFLRVDPLSPRPLSLYWNVSLAGITYALIVLSWPSGPIAATPKTQSSMFAPDSTYSVTWPTSSSCSQSGAHAVRQKRR